MAYKKEERWELRYISKKDGGVKNCYPRSKEKRDEQMQICKDNGVKVIHCKKLYPFNTYANQHNFSLINDICYIRIAEMRDGDIEWNKEEYDKLVETKEKAERFFCLPLPIAWLTWEDWKDAKEMATNAIIHRQNACVENGRPDLVTYC